MSENQVEREIPRKRESGALHKVHWVGRKEMVMPSKTYFQRNPVFPALPHPVLWRRISLK